MSGCDHKETEPQFFAIKAAACKARKPSLQVSDSDRMLGDGKMIIIRTLLPDEVSVLDEFIYEAIFVPQGVDPPPRSIIENDDLQVYVRDFEESPHDHCLVAEYEGKIVGAVWSRMMNDYGHIDKQTPSLAMSHFKEYRGQGIGTRLLRQMLDLLRQEGYGQVSLSVQKENYALRMYLRAGFEVMTDRGGEVLMVAHLNGKE